MSSYNAYNPKDLKDVILRRLGAPIINVEVTEDQIYDCIQRALELYGEYHFNGTHKSYKMFYVGTDDEYTNGVFDMTDDRVFAITQILRTNLGSITSMDGQATYPWFNDFLLGMAGINGGMGSSCSKFYGPNAFGADLSYFTQLMQYNTMLQDLVSPIPDFWFNDNTGMLKVTGTFQKNDIIVVECYTKSYVDTDVAINNQAGYGYAGSVGQNDAWSLNDSYNNPNNVHSQQYAGQDTTVRNGAYNNRWVKDYATCLVKELNGQILAKHQGMQLVGGVTVDGTRLIQEAQDEKLMLRDELSGMDFPVGILIG